MTTKLLASLGILIVCAGIAFGAGYVFFNASNYQAPVTAEFVYPDTTDRDLPGSPALEIAATAPSDGLLVVDAVHRNSYRSTEISILLSKVVDRGMRVEYAGNFRTTDAAKRLATLEEKLRRADALLVILARDAYSIEEVNLVESFVRKGGKLLLITDPTRIHLMNSLSERFGINFQPDYLFNQHENDLNFQNIFIRDFQPDELTAGVNSIALYTAGSIQTSGAGIAFTDEFTESSTSVSGAGLSPIALDESRNVLAVADLTFMIPPHNTAVDNDRLLSNIADFLSTGTREFVLDDFPEFFNGGSREAVDVVIAQPSLLSSGTTVKNGLSELGIVSTLVTVEDFSNDTVFLGLHEDALKVAGYLQSAGIRVDDTIAGPFGEDLDPAGAAIAVLDSNRDRQVVILLADTPETLDKAAGRLLDGMYRQDLVNDFASITSFATESK